MKTITEKERKVLEYLVEIYSNDSNCTYFKYISKGAKLTLRETRLACRSLKRKGYAEFVRGLFNDDGEVAGSGYCATEKGAAYISHCDLCKKINTYEYDGKKECEEHYGKSTKQTELF